jgi:mono/diheme cytochrome c family protein
VSEAATSRSATSETAMQSARGLPTLLGTIVCLNLVSCVAGTPRVASTASPDAPMIARDAPSEPMLSPGDLGAIDTGSPVQPPIDGGPVSTYDAEGQTTPPDTAPSWWPADFVPGSLPDPANGRGSHAGSSACGKCHNPTGAASSRVWLIGGIVYNDAAGTAPVASAEIGIKSGAQFLHTYSASNGYFWLPESAGVIDWTAAEIRIRTIAGDLKMSTPANSGDCQTCHTTGNRIHPNP